MDKRLFYFTCFVISLLCLSCNVQEKKLTINFFPDLVKKEGKFYKKGMEIPYTGTSKSTYKNGNSYVIASFEKGKMHGEYIAYYSNGQKMGVTHYQKGVKQGEAISWHENGELASKVDFKDNVKEGRLVAYYANGQMSREAFFDKGIIDSTYSQWKENGKLYYKAWYEEGELVDKKFFNQDSSNKR